MERTIRRSGFLYRYAYWFMPKKNRPKYVNLCPFFWRLVGVTLAMIPYWFLWVPIGFVTGFFFAARPRIFESDGHSTEYHPVDPGDLVVTYKHWPRFEGAPVWPFAILSIGAVVTVIGFLFFKLKTTVVFDFSLLFWLSLIAASILVVVIVWNLLKFGAHEAKERIAKTEPVQIAGDWLKAKKEKICPRLPVVD